MEFLQTENGRPSGPKVRLKKRRIPLFFIPETMDRRSGSAGLAPRLELHTLLRLSIGRRIRSFSTCTHRKDYLLFPCSPERQFHSAREATIRYSDPIPLQSRERRRSGPLGRSPALILTCTLTPALPLNETFTAFPFLELVPFRVRR